MSKKTEIKIRGEQVGKNLLVDDIDIINWLRVNAPEVADDFEERMEYLKDKITEDK